MPSAQTAPHADSFVLELLRLHPQDVDTNAMVISAVAERFRNGQISVVQLRIFAYQCNGNAVFRGGNSAAHGKPVAEIRLRRVEPKRRHTMPSKSAS